MAPTPQEHNVTQNNDCGDDGERIVITGISGRYPQSQNIKELENILYSKLNPVTAQPRWQYTHPDVSPYVGLIPDLDRFDAQFFKVYYRLGINMDPPARNILEQAYQAIYDAGVSPEHLHGKKIGVFIGICFSETENFLYDDLNLVTGHSLLGCSKTMFANRISYWLNLKGPSMALNASGCSSAVAIEQAYIMMKTGHCDAAIVGGASICLHPQSAVHHSKIMDICKDGKTKCFQENADGCARSEAINMMFLQRPQDALRIYADLVHVKTQYLSVVPDEIGQRYGFYRDPEKVVGFLKDFYYYAGVSPRDVEYVEAFGIGNLACDKTELEVLDKVFCDNRTEPLGVGSVMSNLGYSQAASGISAVTKVLLGYHKGELAANLHCDKPRQDIEGLREGRMHILDEHQPCKRKYTAVNNMSVTGLNCHILLHGFHKPKDLSQYQCDFPRLVLISARHEEGTQKVFDDLKSRPIDPEELALYHNIHHTAIIGHMSRGFTILDTDKNNKTISRGEQKCYFDESNRPLWFVYSGMGSQWVGMGTALLRIPTFAKAIERCRKVLEPKGVDIIDIITSTDEKIFDNILHSFVGIAAIQIGLTDILLELGLVPDKIIGHSVGELGCAYADGCMTAEEMILAAYSRGLVSIQTPFIHGSMAAVGIGYHKIVNMCPPEIEVACHNGPDSSTISGPAEPMREFVAQLTAKGVFAKEVPCSNIAYHSRYIAEAGPALLRDLKEIIPTPKLRSERWVSTSVPENKWNEEDAKYSSAEYHTNNLLNPVLFEESSRLVPNNAVLIEIAPHGLLQAILKRSLPQACGHVPLTRRGHSDSAVFLLQAIGKLYMEGLLPDISKLYPKIEFPVSTETPFLSPNVSWSHTEHWALPLFNSAGKKKGSIWKFAISYHDIQHEYLKGHVVQGKTVYPVAGILVAVWDALAMSKNKQRKELTVEFNDVKLFLQPVLHDSRQLRLTVQLNRGSGYFEVYEEESTIATGYIIEPFIVNKTDVATVIEELEETTMSLKAGDIYRTLRERNYDYTGDFCSLQEADFSLSSGHVVWKGNWVTFLDGLLQFNALRQPHDGVSQPFYIRKLSIDHEEHAKLNQDQILRTTISNTHDHTKCGGVTIEDIRFRNVSPLDDHSVDLKVLRFIPRYNVSESLDVLYILQIFMQIIEENLGKDTINVVHVTDKVGDDSLYQNVKNRLGEICTSKVIFDTMNKDNVVDDVLKKADLVLVQKLSTDEGICQNLYRLLKRETFVVSAEQEVNDTDRVRPSALYRVVAWHSAENIQLKLVKWRPKPSFGSTSAFSVQTTSDIDLLKSARASLPPQHNLIVLTRYPPPEGLKDLVKTWRSEIERNQIYMLMLNHEISRDQNLDNLPDLDLAFNILDHGTWGEEYYVPNEDLRPKHAGITLTSARIGQIDSLNWVEKPDYSKDGYFVKVNYAGLNTFDVKRALGKIPLESKHFPDAAGYGMDFSGISDNGTRVMGVVRRGALTDRVRTQTELLWPVPDHWSLEEAATVPMPYAHAFYCLGVKCYVEKGRSILIHGGAGALGQALISIALGIGCEVFATVSDIRKKRFLCKLFPELKENHIGCSRDNSFEHVIMSATGGLGCDLSILCVKGDLKNVSMNCAKALGYSLDVDQLEYNESYDWGMYHMVMARAYERLNFSSIFELEDLTTMKKIQQLMSSGIARGFVRPLTRVIYEPADVPRAFRLLASSGHRGRVLVRMDKAILPQPVPRIACSPDGGQLVICDDESLGVQLVDMLIKRGAKKLHVFFSNSSPRINLLMNSRQYSDVDIQINTEDLLNNEFVVKLVKQDIIDDALEGVFIMLTKIYDQKAYKTLLENLDKVTKEICSSIKHFAVLGVGNTIGQQLGLSRAQNGLPATMLHVPELIKSSDGSLLATQQSLTYRETVNMMEKALRSTHPIILAHRCSVQHDTLLKRIYAIANITDEVKDDTTLEELGVDENEAHLLSIYLRDTQNISLKVEEILSLTKERIDQIEKTLTDTDFPLERGLSSIFTYVDSDELLATTELVFLQTLIRTDNTRFDEFDTNQAFIVIVPGMEGHHQRYQLMCESLRIEAIVLQPGFDLPDRSIHDVASHYAKTLLKRTELKNNFYLLGYEFGMLVVLETAAILEEHGITGTVFCVGGGPEDFVKELTVQVRAACGGVDSELALQLAVVRHMTALMGGEISPQLDAALRAAPSWQERVEISVLSLRGHITYSNQYARSIIKAAYVRISQSLNYKKVEPKPLQSRIVLLRSPSSSAESLQRYSSHPIEVEDIKAPLFRATDDLRVPALIQKYLDKDVLEEFEKKNLCETYLINCSIFS